jgi:hypothetical protein
VVQQHDASSAPSSFQCAHHAGSARPKNYDIHLLHTRSPLLSLTPQISLLAFILISALALVIFVEEPLFLRGCATIE